ALRKAARRPTSSRSITSVRGCTSSTPTSGGGGAGGAWVCPPQPASTRATRRQVERRGISRIGRPCRVVVVRASAAEGAQEGVHGVCGPLCPLFGCRAVAFADVAPLHVESADHGQQHFRHRVRVTLAQLPLADGGGQTGRHLPL